MSITNTPECFLLDTINDCALLLQNKCVRFANHNFEKLVGYSRTELFGSNNYLFFTPESAHTFSTIISNHFENGYTKMMYLNHRTKGQLLIFVTFTQYEESGSTFISCIFKHFPRDNEERYKWLEMFDEYSDIMASALEYDEKENDFKHVFNSRKAMNMPMFKNLTDTTNWVIKDAGYSREDLKPWLEGYKKLRYSSEAVNSEQSLTIPSTGERTTISVVSRYVGESNENRPIYFQTITDVTHLREIEQELERKTAEFNELASTNAMLKNFFDNAPLCMGIIELVDNDNDAINLFMNPATARLLLGRENAKEVVGIRSTVVGMNPDEVKRWNNYYREAQRTQSTISFETEMTTANKTVVYVSSSVRHVADSTFAYIIQNITPRRQLELELQRHKEELEDTVRHRTAALEEALHVKSRFLGIMSHEIRTPLSGIVGMITLLGDSNLPSEQRDNLHIAQVCCEQLLVVIEDILDITRMEENKLELSDAPFSLHRIIEESLEIVSFESGKKSLELICDMDPGLQDYVSGDASRLRQIIVNLLSNSVKFSFHGEIVLFAASQEIGDGNVKIQFSVKDEGIGIDDASKKRIFEPFNTDISTTRKTGGAGLGLCISKRLTELMGGRMWYESQESQGSIFYFTVILKICERPPLATFLDVEIEKDPVLQVKCRGKQILIIDGCKTLLRVLSSWLGLWGFVPVTITSGAEAIRTLRRADNTQYPIVLISNTENLQVINQVKDMRPVIVMGYEILDGTEVLPFLKKPIRISTLRQQLVRFFLNYKEEENPPARRSSLPPLKILIAEDNIMNQRVIKKVLESIGYPDITIVNNGQEAVDMVITVKFDVIIMDVMMPELGGIEATEMIRHNSMISQPEIVGLTANAFSENINRCLNAGMSKVLTKPIQREQLINVLADIANKVSKVNV